MKQIFIHGLASSSKGIKGGWFRKNFPDMQISDYSGDLHDWLAQLEKELVGQSDLVLVGSSFGGLLAAIFALKHEEQVDRLILLAPALNFPDMEKYQGRSVNTPTHIYIGAHDTVTPPALVKPAARKLFTDLAWNLVDDDHLLRSAFFEIPWKSLLD